MTGKPRNPDSKRIALSSEVMPLGQVSAYVDRYTPSLLYPLARASARAALESYPGTNNQSADVVLPFVGEDVWTAYELTWLDQQGRPQAAILSLRAPCDTPFMVESKSMKLCLNSLAQTVFTSREALQQVLTTDLGQAFGAPISVELFDVDGRSGVSLPGLCIDQSEVQLNQYSRSPELLRCDRDDVKQQQALYTHQFRSLCPVTGQPDFASIWLEYSGPSIEPGALFAYLVSYRTHSGFHESAIEQIFLDLQRCCGCTNLTVYGRFLRRGGVDINPFRSTQQVQAPVWRLARQ